MPTMAGFKLLKVMSLGIAGKRCTQSALVRKQLQHTPVTGLALPRKGPESSHRLSERIAFQEQSKYKQIYHSGT